MTSDLAYQEESGSMNVADGAIVTLGGIIADKSVKYTKNNQAMAFVNLEDLAGSVECVIFPKVYQRCSANIEIDQKVFIKGRVDAGDEQDGKLIVDTVTSFSDISRKLWIRFDTREEYEAVKDELGQMIKDSDGKDTVVIYIANPQAKKELPRNMTVNGSGPLFDELKARFGEGNVVLQ